MYLKNIIRGGNLYEELYEENDLFWIGIYDAFYCTRSHYYVCFRK